MSTVNHHASYLFWQLLVMKKNFNLALNNTSFPDQKPKTFGERDTAPTTVGLRTVSSWHPMHASIRTTIRRHSTPPSLFLKNYNIIWTDYLWSFWDSQATISQPTLNVPTHISEVINTRMVVYAVRYHNTPVHSSELTSLCLQICNHLSTLCLRSVQLH